MPQPAARALSLPARCYVDPAFAAWERQAVFGASWQLVAHATQLAQHGDHVVTEVGGVPLLLVRDRDGTLRALHNVCRHRAGPLALCDGRGARQLVCQYHGWRYGLDGRLRGAPEMGRVAGFDTAAVRLPQARVAQWQNLVFAALDDAAGPFEALVAGIDARLGGAQTLAGWQRHARVSYTLDCDWKVYVDNYLEGYHVPRVHPTLNAALDYASYATELGDWHVLQSSPVQTEAALYGRGEALYYWLWPNTMLNCLPGRLQTNRVLPLGAGRCRVDFEFFYAPG